MRGVLFVRPMRWTLRLPLLAVTVFAAACALDATDPDATLDDELGATKVCATQHSGTTSDGDPVTVSTVALTGRWVAC